MLECQSCHNSALGAAVMIPRASTTGLQVQSGAGDCQIDAAGCAVDLGYGNNERCTIRVSTAGTLTATRFNTESSFDVVTIGGHSYSGSTGPSNVAVTAGSTFTWSSDGSNPADGWQICLTTGLQVQSGPSYCQIGADGCASTVGVQYTNNERCTILVNAAGTLTATRFNTESQYDYVNIGGTQYSGKVTDFFCDYHLANVAVAAGTTFSWYSDESNTADGWTICLTTSSFASIRAAAPRPSARATPV